MDRRLFIPVFIMLASVLLLSGLMDLQAGSAQESPDQTDPDPVLAEKETVTQNSPKASSAAPTEISSNRSESTVAPASEPTMMSFGGGGSLAEEEEEEDKGTPVPENDQVPEVTADFSVETSCLNASFTDMSQNATSVKWDFGDGSNSKLSDPEHTYPEAGSYTVNLTAYGENGVTDSTEKIVNVESCAGPVDEGEDEQERIPDPVTQEVPEFPTIAIPMVAIIGMAFFFSRRQ